MAILKYTTLMLTLASCNLALAQQQFEQGRRSERIEERRDQLGQNRNERQDNRDARQAARADDGQLTLGTDNAAASDMDQFIATCLLIGNQEEVALAQEAVNRAQNENVKQFAQTLVDDHQKAIQRLQAHAKTGMGLEGAASVTASADAGSNQIAANASPTAQQYTVNRVNADRDSAGAGGLDKVLKMQQQAAQECLSMTKSIMAEKQGVEFDKAFAGSQIGACWDACQTEGRPAICLPGTCLDHPRIGADCSAAPRPCQATLPGA